MTKKENLFLVGFGTMGKLIYQVLKEIDLVEITRIDPVLNRTPNTLTCIEEIKQVPPGQNWIVATPTDCHSKTIQKIIELDPKAKILCEKPLCHPDQFADLCGLILKNPSVQIHLHDIYSFSAPLAKLKENLQLHKKIDSLTCELSKNRLIDQARGRFKDEVLGPAGYEGYHLLSIAKSLLGPLDRNQSLKAKRTFNPQNEFVWEGDWAETRVTLSSTTDGKILSTPRVSKVLSKCSTSHNKETLSPVPFSPNFRYRFVEVSQGDFHFGIIWESDFGFESSKTNHLFYKGYKSNLISWERISDSPIHKSIRSFLTNRDSNPNREFNIEIASHIQLFRLAAQTKKMTEFSEINGVSDVQQKPKNQVKNYSIS